VVVFVAMLKLDKSEDLECRRLIRSRLRVINKTKQTSGTHSFTYLLAVEVHYKMEHICTYTLLSANTQIIISSWLA
jgi:Smoothelin cytoskeleton protein